MVARHKRTVSTLALGLAAVFLLAFGSGCGGSDPGPDFGANDPDVVVAMGDSITFGLYDIGVESCSESYRKAGGFCPRLQGLSDKIVINEGVCSVDSFYGAAEVQDILRSRSPGVLLILYSPNDLNNGTDAVIRNLRTMIGAATSNMTVPVVGTLTPAVGVHAGWNPFIESLNVQIRNLCDELDVECADHNEAFKKDSGFAISPYALLSEDGLHPNATGYDVMAETWNSALKRVY